MSLVKQKVMQFFFGRSTLPESSVPEFSLDAKDMKDYDLVAALGDKAPGPESPHASYTIISATGQNAGAAKSMAELDFRQRQLNHRRVGGTFYHPVCISNLNLEYCQVIVQPYHELRFERCMFVNCDIRILQDNEKTQAVLFEHSALKQCRITYTTAGVDDAVFAYENPKDNLAFFNTPDHQLRHTRLSFDGSRLTSSHINTICSSLALQRTQTKDCRFRGYVGDFHAEGTLEGVDIRTVGNDWKSNGLNMVEGVWYPYLNRSMSAERTQFTGTFIDASQIARHCESKEGIDIQHAEVDDTWETLRGAFTGTRFFLHLVLVAGFVLPILGKGLFIAAYSQMYDKAGPMVEEMNQGAWLDHGDIIHMPMVEVLAYGGYTGTAKWIHFGTFIGLVLYNLLRYALTMWVSALREREEHRAAMGFKLCRPSDDQVKWPWRMHTALNWLLLVAMAASIWHMLEFLLIDVPYLVR